MKGLLLPFFAAAIFLLDIAPASAEDSRWRVGQSDEFYVAMAKQIDDVFIAIYVTKEPSIYASPLMLETVVGPCGEKKRISLHRTEAILAYGTTVEERLEDVREALERVVEDGHTTCDLADDLEAHLFTRFDDAYRATDAILVEAGIFPLTDPFQDLDESAEGKIEEESN